MHRILCLTLALSGCHLFDPKPAVEWVLAVDSDQPAALQQTALTMRNRLDRAGVRGSKVEVPGDGKVHVLLPALPEPQRVRALLTRPARLEFRIVEEDATVALLDGFSPPAPVTLERDERHWDMGGTIELYLAGPAKSDLEAALASVELPKGHSIAYGLLPARMGEESRMRSWLVGEPVLTGDSIESASTKVDEYTMRYNVFIRFDEHGARAFEKATEENVQRKLAILLDGEMMSAPVIMERISGGAAQITLGGMQSPEESRAEAEDLASMLAGGALPAPVTLESETIIGR